MDGTVGLTVIVVAQGHHVIDRQADLGAALVDADGLEVIRGRGPDQILPDGGEVESLVLSQVGGAAPAGPVGRDSC